MTKKIQLKSIITCPECGFSKEETMPKYSWISFYECSNCGRLLRPKKGDCCVFFCSRITFSRCSFVSFCLTISSISFSMSKEYNLPLIFLAVGIVNVPYPEPISTKSLIFELIYNSDKIKSTLKKAVHVYTHFQQAFYYLLLSLIKIQ